MVSGGDDGPRVSSPRVLVAVAPLLLGDLIRTHLEDAEADVLLIDVREADDLSGDFDVAVTTRQLPPSVRVALTIQLPDESGSSGRGRLVDDTGAVEVPITGVDSILRLAFQGGPVQGTAAAHGVRGSAGPAQP